ncbi:MAG TPA: hypothetical protein VHI52_06500 [Verrucomicrobiae bacterium]|nr:hypothetical protein [Verrucomicrobiae bacterium]
MHQPGVDTNPALTPTGAHTGRALTPAEAGGLEPWVAPGETRRSLATWGHNHGGVERASTQPSLPRERVHARGTDYLIP